MDCTKCETALDAQARFCSHCGEAVTRKQVDEFTVHLHETMGLGELQDHMNSKGIVLDDDEVDALQRLLYEVPIHIQRAGHNAFRIIGVGEFKHFL